jgi:hypothetical protein
LRYAALIKVGTKCERQRCNVYTWRSFCRVSSQNCRLEFEFLHHFKTPNLDFVLLNFCVVAPAESHVKLWEVEFDGLNFKLLYIKFCFFLTGSL